MSEVPEITPRYYGIERIRHDILHQYPTRQQLLSSIKIGRQSGGSIKQPNSATRANRDWTIEAHYKDGQLHRTDGPARIASKGTQRTEEWVEYGQLHRTDGPAWVTIKADGSREEKWYNHGGRDGPLSGEGEERIVDAAANHVNQLIVSSEGRKIVDAANNYVNQLPADYICTIRGRGQLVGRNSTGYYCPYCQYDQYVSFLWHLNERRPYFGCLQTHEGILGGWGLRTRDCCEAEWTADDDGATLSIEVEAIASAERREETAPRRPSRKPLGARLTSLSEPRKEIAFVKCPLCGEKTAFAYHQQASISHFTCIGCRYDYMECGDTDD